MDVHPTKNVSIGIAPMDPSVKMENAELDPTENNINNFQHSHIKRLGKDGEGHKQVGATEHKRDSMAERVKMVKK